MNKKVLTIGGILLALILLIILFNIEPNGKEKKEKEDLYQIINNAQEESNNITEEEQKELKEIRVSEYLELLGGTENNMVFVGRPTCSYCQIATPIVKNIAYKYDLEINYLNTDNFEDEDGNNFINSSENFKEGFGTPMLLLVRDHKIQDMIDGLTDTKHYIEFFKKYGFIK